MTESFKKKIHALKASTQNSTDDKSLKTVFPSIESHRPF